ncbi:MAG: carboxylesterase family protein [Sandaracinaceae bacterium]|nr:carboxylesterase family protein [Sandaracinaceae bacterium]
MRTAWGIFAVCFLAACGGPVGADGGADAATPDAGATDAGAADAGVDLDAALDLDAAVDVDAGPPLGDTVPVESGDARGVIDDDLAIFRGIPYAAPPVGSLRFRPPEAPAPFDGTFDASAFGPTCVQRQSGRLSGEEDCLTVNLWAPRAPGPRPVMVFIHGGGFTGGSGSAPSLEASALARAGDVVVVTFNYRLGAFGFLTTEALAAESTDGSIGNYGLMDQIALLGWIARNVGAFGGDPGEVTIFGESAGAVSVCAHLGSPRSDGLYHRAIIQSGGGCAGFEDPRATTDRASMMERGAALVSAVGCTGGVDEPACLRALPPVAILDAEAADLIVIRDTLMRSLEYAPNLDGVVLTEDPVDRAARDGTVPVVTGSNADEATLFTLTTVVNRLNYRARLAAVFGDARADAVMAVYPVDAFGDAKTAYDAALTDALFVCPTLTFAGRVAGARVYHLTRALTGSPFAAVGVAHGLDLAYLFGNYPGTYAPNAGDLALGATMQAAWTTFARAGAPETTPPWSVYASATPSVLLLDEPVTEATEIRSGRCAALAAIP